MKKLRKKLNGQDGFTLVEMLIVVAIIAILIAISIPMVNKALEKAREATDAANERAALGAAMVEVLTENKLAGTAIAGDAAVSAYYSIGDGKNGSMVSTKPTGSAGGYGKGTASGDVPTSHVGQTIKVTYDPTVTGDATNQFVVSWE